MALEAITRACFNGAASVKTRKCWVSVGAAVGVVTLQWGRVGEDAEMSGAAAPQGAMTWLQWGRVGEDAEIRQPTLRK